MQKLTKKERLLKCLTTLCSHIDGGTARSNHCISEVFILNAWVGPRLKVKFIGDKKSITGIQSFRDVDDERSVQIGHANAFNAWKIVPEHQRIQLTDFLACKDDIQIITTYTLTYKGRPVNKMLDSGPANGARFPHQLSKYTAFRSNDDAVTCAFALRKYINEVKKRDDKPNK